MMSWLLLMHMSAVLVMLVLGCHKTGCGSSVGSVSASQAAVPRSIHASGTFFHGNNNFPLPLSQEELVVSY